MADTGPSATASEFAASEMPISEGEATPGPTASGFPPYPPYAVEAVCPSLADAILAGRDIRIKHKSMPLQPSRPPPKMARPRGPKATDVKMSRQATRSYARCLRRHNAILTDRLERMSKPFRRNVINFWREKADTLPASTINRLRAMLDADEPFKPDQAYEYFINLRKTKKKNKTKDGVRQVKKGLTVMCADKRFAWARNATVAFARGIQQRLSRPGRYALADGMLRLSNIIMGDLCTNMNMKTPSRRCHHPKAKFMMEMSDKIAVWIDEILCESDDRMLMMDFDEDEDILNPGGPGGGGGGRGDARFADDFLNMMAGGGLLQGPSHAYLKFSGPMLQAFNILTDSMKKKESQPLLDYGKFKQTYSEAADTLKSAPDFEATHYDTQLAEKVNSDLADTVASDTPQELENAMKEMVDICSNYLAQNAEFNKDKGKAFNALVKAMNEQPGQPLYNKNKASRTMGPAAKELENAKGLQSNYDDPNLSQEIHGKLANLASQVPELSAHGKLPSTASKTPDKSHGKPSRGLAIKDPHDSKADLAETLDLASKYLSERAVDENERGPAFDHLVKTLEKTGGKKFSSHPQLATSHAAATALKSAPGLSSSVPDPATAPKIKDALHKAVDASTPPGMGAEMKNTIAKTGDYLSGFARDRDKALSAIIEMMKKDPSKEVAKRNDYAMNYGQGAKELETAPNINSSYLPVKDIADEIKQKLSADMENKVAPNLVPATKVAIDDCADHLSQSIALRSKAAGDRYPQNFLGAVLKTFGKIPLFKHKGHGTSYADAADTLKFAGPLESDPKAEQLASEISTKLDHNLPLKLAPDVVASLKDTGIIEDAAKHLAKTGRAKGEALDHLTGLMNKKGDAPLGVLQGYEQTYQDGARRLTDAPSLASDKVDKGAYANVSAKLQALNQEKPSSEHQEYMPGIIEDSSKYLSAPIPENEAEKRSLLADLMARKKSDEFDKAKMYKINYKEAGEEIQNAPVGKAGTSNRKKATENEGKINSVIPNKKLQELLKSGVREGAAHLANTVDSRGNALQDIHDALKKEGDKEFMKVGKFSKTHKEAADMIADAKSFGGQSPHPVVKDIATQKIGELDTGGGSPLAQKSKSEAESIASDFFGGIATKESGLDAQGLAALGSLDGGAAAVARGAVGAGGVDPSETEEQRRKRLGLPPETDQEQAQRKNKLGLSSESEEERADRLEAERRKRLGLPPETAAQRADRIEAERRRRLGLPPETDQELAERRKKQGFPPETDEERAQRKKNLGLSPESEEERADRLEAERRKRLGLPPETAAQRADRIEAERRRRLGLPPETDQELAERRKKQGFPPETDEERAQRKKQLGLSSESEEDRADRLEAERRKRLGLPPETAAQRADRIEAERRRRLGLPPETDQERAERKKKQGFPPETDEERAQRKKNLGLSPESEEERADRLEAERRKRLGLPPETAAQRADRIEAERRRRLGLPPETDQELAERRKKQGFPPETDEERAQRKKHLGLSSESEEDRADRLEAERRKRLGLPPETAAQRADRIEAERRRRLGLPPETDQERAERRKKQGFPPETDEERAQRKKKTTNDGGGDEPERIAALDILHSQLRAKGSEIFYKQPHTVLTHSECSDWLKQKPPVKVDKIVRESGDASRLSKKFEKKLDNLVHKITPPAMQDTMQDVVIESARNLAEGFVATNYKALVKHGLIAEMQKKENEILIEENGAAETCFFAAQRLKKAKSYEPAEPCDHATYYINKKLDEIIRNRTMARKLTGVMKEHIKEAAAYLSGSVTKPDPDIEAYVALLGEMEVTGDALLIEGDIPKSYKDSAAYLRTLTMYEDQINRSDPSLQAKTESKLRDIMANVPPRGYQSSHMTDAIRYATKLLVSYIKLQGEKTEALNFLTERLKEGGSGVLLRHGVIRKSYADGADLLEGKNADQLNVTSAEPVVARKIQIKLVKLIYDGTVPAKYQGLIDDLIEDATLYLAVNLLQPRVIQVCKCMKNVFVQCELWCDEILRRVARPCCKCSRHVSAAALADLSPMTGKGLQISADHTSAIGPGIQITLKTCPSARRSRSRIRQLRDYAPCPANEPSPDCPYNSNRNYDVHYSTCEISRFGSPPHHDQTAINFTDYQQPTTSANYPEMPTSSKAPHLTRLESLLFNVNAENFQFLADEEKTAIFSSLSSGSSPSYHTPMSTSGQSDSKSTPFWQTPTTMFASLEKSHNTRTNAQARTPIVSTDQMADWQAMMVSLMWNIQAWREWIQENIDRALRYQQKPGTGEAVTGENWVVFQRRVATEALQWRQYNIFSRQLTLRLSMRYKNKRIVSPTRATNQTGNYLRCQVEMLEIIEMFNRWTQWLTAVVKETTSLSLTPAYDGPMEEMRWKYFKNKIIEYLDDWTKYNDHLKVCWENKHKTHIAGWLPAWRQPGPVWVVSACGAVPSGAVSGGLYDNEMIWVARTTHRCNVLPAALHPSKHSCVVYADGGVHHYTKYQVMCNAEVQWQAWRAGKLGARAVRVAPGTYVGRIHYRGSHLIGAVYTPNYRCHVVIFGRPFAFNCYELLVLKKDEEGT